MNWVQVYRDDVIASIFGTPLTGFGRYSRWTRNAAVRYAITSNDHHITPQIQLHQISGARRCSIINTRQGG